MTKILIDTNIFIGLYESNKDSIEIFQDIDKIKHQLVFSNQIYDEFLRNRDIVLQRLITQIKNINKVGMHSTSLISNTPEYIELKSIKNSFKGVTKDIITKIEKMIDDTDNDQIFCSFIKLYTDENVQIIERNDTLIHKAFYRKLTGNPPISNKTDTIGDEIIWESLLDNLDEDLIIISRDSTYKEHSTFLKEEYRVKTQKSLTICENLSDAFDLIGEEVSLQLLEFDEELKCHKDIENYATILKSYLFSCTIDQDAFNNLKSLCEVDQDAFNNLKSFCKVDQDAFNNLKSFCKVDQDAFNNLKSLCEVDQDAFNNLKSLCKVDQDVFKNLKLS